ncbi:MAG: SDR family NAD(P)-dependent oxidoreductase, partial [Candidatus Altiarchaeota archaeon]
MNIAVTGGAGFIGSHLCEHLLEKGHYVVSLDNYSTGTKENISHLKCDENFREVTCDILDKEILENVFSENNVELVYHYAAVVGVKRTLENPKKVFEVNITGTENVLDAALHSGCKKVVNISSSEVYGHPVEVPEREDSPKNVELPYAISKLVGEKYAGIYNNMYGLKTTSLRLFNTYGPKQSSTPYGFVVGIFINRVL